MTAREILEHFETEKIKNQLAKYPQYIFEAKEAVNNIREELKMAETELKEAEAMLITEIALETNGNGKPKFGNERTRQAELIKRQANSEDYQAVLENLKHIQRKLDNAQLNLELLYDEFRATHYIARITEAELRIISRGF